MLFLIVILAGVVVLGWYIWNSFLHRFIGTENRHRWFAEYLKDFPVFYNAKTLNEKKKLFEPLQTLGKTIRILEIGAGSGANLEFYPENTMYTVVDPNPFFQPHLEKNLAKYPNIKLDKCVVSGAEKMKGVPDHSIDAVVSTLVLCSVNDIQNTFKEIQRVLVPGGKFFFMEHVRDEHWNWRWLLQAIGSNIGLYQFLFDGCRNDKNISKEISKARFAHVEAKRFNLDLSEGVPLSYMVLHLVVPHLYGTATTKQ